MSECPGYRPAPPVLDESTDFSEISRLAAVGTDLEWHLSPEHPHLFCGGCGLEAAHCHPGRCCTEARDRLNVLDSVCDLCPERYATGQVVAP